MATADEGTWIEEVPEPHRRTKWGDRVELLKTKPGTWRMYEVSSASSIASHIKSTYPGVETTTRFDRELYIRWPKGKK